MNNRSALTSYLDRLEKKFPVEEWKINDIYIWPILKIKLFFLINRYSNESYTQGAQDSNPSKYQKIIRWIKSALSYLKLKITPLPKSKYLFAGAYTHRVLFKNKYYNRYFDSIIDKFETKKEKNLLIEYKQNTQIRGYYRLDRVLFIEKYIPFFELKYRFFKKNNSECLYKFHDLIVTLKNDFSIAELENIKVSILNTVKQIEIHADLFNSIFDKIKPKYVFGLCYYNNPMFGMNLAAYRKQITSVDMQHGTQGPDHVAYGNFITFPQSGYNVLPKIFWCWDHDSYKTISNWISNQNFHEVILGGNPWWNIWEETNYSFPFLTQHQKIILYTLQPVGELLDEYIIETIKKSPNNFIWWLRLHPRQMQEKENLIYLIQQNGIQEKVNINDASSLPLPLILKKASVHISKFSGSIIEANQFNVPNIILHPTGAKSFESLLEDKKNVVFLNSDSETFLKIIIELSRYSDSSDKEVDSVKFSEVFKNKFDLQTEE